jgi:hypothetical protein
MRTVSTPVVTGVVRVDVRTLQRAAPRVAPGRITARRLRSVASTLLGLASHFAVACGDDGAGPGGFSGEGTGPGSATNPMTAGSASGADSTGGFAPDPEACLPLACVTAQDCCGDLVPGAACPGTYPDNWTCTPFGTCELGNCVGHLQCSDLFTGFECQQVGTRGRCVAPCGNDSACESLRNMPGTVCVASDDPARKYCRQPL